MNVLGPGYNETYLLQSVVVDGGVRSKLISSQGMARNFRVSGKELPRVGDNDIVVCIDRKD